MAKTINCQQYDHLAVSLGGNNYSIVFVSYTINHVVPLSKRYKLKITPLEVGDEIIVVYKDKGPIKYKLLDDYCLYKQVHQFDTPIDK